MTRFPQRSIPSPASLPPRRLSTRFGVWMAAVLGMLALPLATACDDSPATTESGAGGSTGTNSGGGHEGGAAGGSEPMPCIGPEPRAESFHAVPAPRFISWDLLPEMPKEPGTEAPVYQLTDFQPQSCSHRATYGLDQFRNKVTVAALLAGW